MALDVRKNAATMPANEMEDFIKACVLLKSKIVPGQTFSVYDQWVAIHACIMGVRSPGTAMFRNIGHHDIGFLPWHREYLRRFELDLQSVVPGVTIPYWPWPMTPEPSVLFSNARMHRIFFSSNQPQNVGGLFSPTGPPTPPAWWPTGFRWRVHPALRGGGTMALRRGSPVNSWPPGQATITSLENSNSSGPGRNAYWEFWRQLETGNRTHNTGHNIVGGNMSNPVFSPNDPLFWLHHSYLDRIWSRWQANRVAAQPGSTLSMFYPPSTEISPFTGRRTPVGHRAGDLMWPWVGTTVGFAVNSPAAIQSMLPNFSALPGRRIRQVFDNTSLGSGMDGYIYT